MTSIFNHKQIRAAEILENQSKESKVPSESIHSIENVNAGVKGEGGAASSNSTPVTEINEDTNASDPESTEALRQQIEAAKDVKATLDDLNNDVKFVPDLEGSYELQPSLRLHEYSSSIVRDFTFALHDLPTVTDNDIRIRQTNVNLDSSDEQSHSYHFKFNKSSYVRGKIS